MAKTTEKQFVVWTEYLEELYNSPDRHDYYLMQVAAEVRKGNVARPNQVKIDSFKLKFEKPKPLRAFDADEDSRMMMALMMPAIYGSKYEMPKLP